MRNTIVIENASLGPKNVDWSYACPFFRRSPDCKGMSTDTMIVRSYEIAPERISTWKEFTLNPLHIYNSLDFTIL